MLYRIGTVARLVGVEVATLRNWEQRYGIVVGTRSAGGQRFYSREDVERLRFVKHRIDAGLSAAEAHNLLRERLTPTPRETMSEEIRAEARRVRAEVAATRARAAAEQKRSVRTLTLLAESAEGDNAARLEELAARARRRERRLRARAVDDEPLRG